METNIQKIRRIVMIKTLESKKVYKGKIIDVYRDKVKLENGKVTYRDVVRHIDAVAIFAIDNRENVLVVKQFRYPVGKELIELPAGLIDEGETPLEAAKRELKEETGYKANKWDELIHFFTSAGCHDEMLYIYIAQDIEKVSGQDLDSGEILTYNKIPFQELYNMVVSGEIEDGKTIIGTMMASNIIK